jgi:hypothetical protein
MNARVIATPTLFPAAPAAAARRAAPVAPTLAGALVAAVLGAAVLGAAVLGAAPAAAQAEGGGGLLGDMARSAREALRGLAETTGPWAEGLAPLLADPGAWEAPETLPNGDILIRRKPAPEAAPGPAPTPEAEPFRPDPDAPSVDL